MKTGTAPGRKKPIVCGSKSAPLVLAATPIQVMAEGAPPDLGGAMRGRG